MREYGVKPADQQLTPEARYEAIVAQVQNLDPHDTACLLDYLLGVRKTDTALIDKALAWVNENTTTPSTLERLKTIEQCLKAENEPKKTVEQDASNTSTNP